MNLRRVRNRNRAGFTLIELLVVVAITGLLIATAITSFSGSRVQLNLLAERARLVDTLSRVNAYSQETLFPNIVDPIDLCGFGVKFDYDNNEYFIYGDKFEGPQTAVDCRCDDDNSSGSLHTCAYTEGTDIEIEGSRVKLPDQIVFNDDNANFSRDGGTSGFHYMMDYVVFQPPISKAEIVRKDNGTLIAGRQQEGYVIIETVESAPRQIWICVTREGAVSYDACPPPPL